MSERAIRRMDADEFLEWGLYQDCRYELVNGVPMAMAGAKRRHDQIVANALGLLYLATRGGRCLPFTADTAIRIPSGNIRRPDAGIDCGAYDDDATTADAPVLVVEVLSPSTRDFDMFAKLDEYKTVPSLRHIVIIDPDTPQAYHWSRTEDDAWRHALLEGLEQTIAMPDIPCTLALAALYEGLTFQPRPRLVAER
jgi:Uma2 family endonuclease